MALKRVIPAFWLVLLVLQSEVAWNPGEQLNPGKGARKLAQTPLGYVEDCCLTLLELFLFWFLLKVLCAILVIFKLT